jgi:hypothetical protein
MSKIKSISPRVSHRYPDCLIKSMVLINKKFQSQIIAKEQEITERLETEININPNFQETEEFPRLAITLHGLMLAREDIWALSN